MVPGACGVNGVDAPKLVTVEFRQGRDNVTVRHQQEAGHTVPQMLKMVMKTLETATLSSAPQVVIFLVLADNVEY